MKQSEDPESTNADRRTFPMLVRGSGIVRERTREVGVVERAAALRVTTLCVQLLEST